MRTPEELSQIRWHYAHWLVIHSTCFVLTCVIQSRIMAFLTGVFVIANATVLANPHLHKGKVP